MLKHAFKACFNAFFQSLTTATAQRSSHLAVYWPEASEVDFNMELSGVDVALRPRPAHQGMNPETIAHSATYKAAKRNKKEQKGPGLFPRRALPAESL